MNKDTNDALRKQIPRIVMPNLLAYTQGIAAMDPLDIANIMMLVKYFNDFNESNDPYGEHDFGAFDYNGQKIFWKIDDHQGQDSYELILTVMLAEEY